MDFAVVPAFCNADISIAAKMAIIAITTNIPIRVNLLNFFDTFAPDISTFFSSWGYFADFFDDR